MEIFTSNYPLFALLLGLTVPPFIIGYLAKLKAEIGSCHVIRDITLNKIAQAQLRLQKFREKNKKEATFKEFGYSHYNPIFIDSSWKGSYFHTAYDILNDSVTSSLSQFIDVHLKYSTYDILTVCVFCKMVSKGDDGEYKLLITDGYVNDAYWTSKVKYLDDTQANGLVEKMLLIDVSAPTQEILVHKIRVLNWGKSIYEDAFKNFKSRSLSYNYYKFISLLRKSLSLPVKPAPISTENLITNFPEILYEYETKEKLHETVEDRAYNLTQQISEEIKARKEQKQNCPDNVVDISSYFK